MTRARSWLLTEFAAADLSDIYSTPALNGRSADYLNMVARVSTELPLAELTAQCKEFEAECGRTPESKSRGSIEMDVDIMQYGDDILRSNEWTRDYFLIGLNQLESRSRSGSDR